MAFSNYYVGSNLTDLGNNITRDTMSQRENDRLMQQALLQALAQRQQHEQAQQQFQQELAFRQQQAQQQNAYQNALLGLKQQEFQNQTTGFTPRDIAEQQYRYAALQNALDIAKQQATVPGQQAAAAYINQNGLNFRDQQLAKEAADAENQSAMARAAEYNARAKMIDDAAAEAKAKGSKHWWNSQSAADEESNKIIKQGYADLMMALSQDKRPGTISPDASGRRFVPVQRNVAAPQMFYGGLEPHLQQQLQFNPPQQGTNPPQSALLQALNGTNTLSNTAPITSPSTAAQQRDVPIVVQTSNGKLWDTTSSRFTAFKLRDPGARIVDEATQIKQNTQPSALDNVPVYTSGRTFMMPEGTRQQQRIDVLNELAGNVDTGQAPLSYVRRNAFGYTRSDYDLLRKALQSSALRDRYGNPIKISQPDLDTALRLIAELQKQ